jgi:hypothetical protein
LYPYLLYISSRAKYTDAWNRCLQPCRTREALRTTKGDDEATHCCRRPAFNPCYLSFLGVSGLVVDYEFEPKLRWSEEDDVKIQTEEDDVKIQTEEQRSIKVNNMLFVTHYPKLTKVALQLLVMHPTSASTERNWSLWGRVYIASRNALAMTRAGKMILLQVDSASIHVHRKVAWKMLTCCWIQLGKR